VSLVSGVIKSSVKAAKRRKPFNSGCRVANVAHRMLISGGKLLRMTSRTGRMTGHPGRRRTAFALVTEQAGKPRVLRIRMLESGIILAFVFCFKSGDRLNRFALEIIACLSAVNKNESENEASGSENQQPEPELQAHCPFRVLRIVFGCSVHNSVNYLIKPE
jgi:hypothetical protein